LTGRVARLRRSAPVALLLVGLVLLGSAVAGIARIDDPLRAAAVDSPSRVTFRDVAEHRGPSIWRDGAARDQPWGDASGSAGDGAGAAAGSGGC
jgi:hypothetical protein